MKWKETERVGFAHDFINNGRDGREMAIKLGACNSNMQWQWAMQKSDLSRKMTPTPTKLILELMK